MKEFLVNITETFSKTVIVKAPDAEEAERLVYAAQYGDLHWESCDKIKFDYLSDNSDLTSYVVEEIPEEHQKEEEKNFDILEFDPDRDNFAW